MSPVRVLTANPGSSSVKLAVVDEEVERESITIDAASVPRAHTSLSELAGRWAPIDAAAIRFVHGGAHGEPVLLDARVLARLAELVPLAPLHQPLSLTMADVVRSELDVPVVACFDTAFHATMPEPATWYALPRDWVRDFGLRRHGFHGLSCANALRRCAELLGADSAALGIVCAHVGSGVSVTAIQHGRSMDTSMGLTPLEGAVMGTRSGSVDPGLLLHLLDIGLTDSAGLAHVLSYQSGLAGMTGTSGDMREVLAARTSGDDDAALAIEVYLHRLRREIGAVSASLARLDALVFTGGVAEHQPDLIAELVSGLRLLGVAVDPIRLRGTGDRVISPARSRVPVLLVTAREDLEMARQATNLLTGYATGPLVAAKGIPS